MGVRITTEVEIDLDAVKDRLSPLELMDVFTAAANKLALAAEEMAVNTARFGHPGKQGAIDVLVRCGEADMLLRLRDDGTPFDPTVYTPEERQTIAVGGIEVVRRVASDISYARQLGFNVTIVTVPAARLAGQVP